MLEACSTPAIPGDLHAPEVDLLELQLLRISNSLTPICALPREILSLIFELGQAIEQDDAQDFGRSEDSLTPAPSHFEVLMTHVSSHFRDVAISTHLLWALIHVSPARSMEEVAAYLSRSDHCRLGVRIDLDGELLLSARTMAHIDMVLPHLRRYHRLVIISGRESRGNYVMQRLSLVEAPILKHLSIDVCVDEIYGRDVRILREGAPKLSFVRLRGLAISLFRPPLENVITLHLDQTEPLPILYDTFRQIVTASPYLANLSVYGDIINAQQAWPGASNPLDLPYLRRLRICGIGGGIYSGLLLGINAPRLQSLVLKDVQESDLERLWASPDIRSKFPMLRNLTFCDFEISSEAYKNVFQAFPAVTCFTTTHYSNIPRILLELAESPSEIYGVPWPALHTLTFLLNFSDTDLIEEIVRGRMVAGHALTTLRLGTVHSLSALQEFAWLWDNILIEKLERFDQWPFASYGIDSDEDDNLFG